MTLTERDTCIWRTRGGDTVVGGEREISIFREPPKDRVDERLCYNRKCRQISRRKASLPLNRKGTDGFV